MIAYNFKQTDKWMPATSLFHELKLELCLAKTQCFSGETGMTGMIAEV